MAASSTISVASGTSLTLSGTSGVTFSSSYVYGFERTTSAVTVSSSSATVNTMGGLLTSQSNNLGSGSSETIALTNSRISATSIVWVTVKTRCSSGYVTVASATASSGSAAIVVYNIGSSACSSTYQLFFLVLN